MASWLRAAEELFEVVDRTAKQVVPVTASDALQRKVSLSTPSKEKTSGSETSLQSARSLTKAWISAQGVDERTANGVQLSDSSDTYDLAEKSADDAGESAGLANGRTSHEHVNCDMITENGMVTVSLHTGVEGEESKKLAEQPKDLTDQKHELKLEEEAAKLLQSAASSGKSKEARLAKVCAGLSTRLQELKAENAQLEELLQLEKETRTSIDIMLSQLQQDLALARSATNAVESEMAGALMSKNAEIEVLSVNLESVKRKAQVAEEKLALVQTEMESVMQNRDLAETRMIQTLRQELASAERRAEEERAAHSNTRLAAVERETELEQRMAESTAAVMRMQKVVEERSQKASELEQKVSMLEIECSTLNKELQSMESRVRRELKRQPEEISQNAWREEAERARLAQREAEGKLSFLEAECQRLRVDLASAKRDSDVSSTQAHMELEKRFRELTELLYLKQTQLETMASEKAAAFLQLEKESRNFREAKAEVERSRRQFSAIGDDDENGLRSFDYSGLQQRRTDSPSLRRIVGPGLQTAAKFLDSGAVTAGRYLWRRPLARIFVLFYLVFVHLFLMYLLHRLQAQTIDSKEDFEFAAAGSHKSGA